MDISLFGFVALAVIIQIICDMLFYLVFTIAPKNHNDILSCFKIQGLQN